MISIKIVCVALIAMIVSSLAAPQPHKFGVGVGVGVPVVAEPVVPFVQVPRIVPIVQPVVQPYVPVVQPIVSVYPVFGRFG